VTSITSFHQNESSLIKVLNWAVKRGHRLYSKIDGTNLEPDNVESWTCVWYFQHYEDHSAFVEEGTSKLL